MPNRYVPTRIGVLALAILSAAGCGNGESTVSGRGFPPHPAACAGPTNDKIESQRQQDWEAANAELDGTKDGVTAMWITFSRVLAVQEAQLLAADFRLSGVRLAYRLNGGTVYKASHTPSPGDFAATELAVVASRALSISLDAVSRFGEAPADERVAAGEPPISGLRIVGTPAKMADLAIAQECLIFSVGKGASTNPVLSPAVDP